MQLDCTSDPERAAQFAAIPYMQLLAGELERVFDLPAEFLIRYAHIRRAALAAIAATKVGEIDPVLCLRLALSADDGLRHWSGYRQ